MQKIRCKMLCTSKGQSSYGAGQKVIHNYEFTPQYDDKCEENKAFWDATPSGKLEIGCTYKKDLEVGRFYYIDLTPAEV